MANVVITLSQFCNFITKTGMHRYNAVKSIYRDLHSDYTKEQIIGQCYVITLSMF